MEEKKYEKKIRRFRRRMLIEATIQAGSVGLALGLAGAAAVLLSGRIFLNTICWMGAATTAALLFALTLLICLFVIRPKKKEVLARIDNLGLQERVITMEELKQVETVMAQAQRRDTRTHLDNLKVSSLKIKPVLTPLFFSIGFAMAIALLVLWPLPEQPTDELAEKAAMEIEYVDELIAVLTEIVNSAQITDDHKSGLREIIEALTVSFTPEDSTLTRTAKIATASRRLDLYEAGEQERVTILKQQADTSEGAQNEVKKARTEQIRLSQTIQDMKKLMGTLIDVLNMVEGSVWAPEVPSGSNYSEEDEFSMEEEPEAEDEPTEGEDPPEGEEPQEGMEPGQDGDASEDTEGNGSAFGNELIYDPEKGEVSYGVVFEEYYQEILKALTEQEYSEEIRKMIEDYANSLE